MDQDHILGLAVIVGSTLVIALGLVLWFLDNIGRRKKGQ